MRDNGEIMIAENLYLNLDKLDSGPKEPYLIDTNIFVTVYTNVNPEDKSEKIRNYFNLLSEDNLKYGCISIQNLVEFVNVTKNKIKLSQENIKGLHKILVKDLGVKTGYKKEEIIVNNKKTCPPNQVRKEMTDLINWWEDNVKTKKNKFLLAIKFHQKFEKIHPFTDGNGRVGRLILIWMITNFGYGVILFKNKNRQKYYEALNQADEGRNKKLYLFAIETYKKTFNNIIKEIS
jgi:Fic family protein